MNEYKITDLFVGMKETFSRTITSEMMQKFYDITLDENPLHRDLNFAREMGYENQVVYGMLTASFMSTLGGCYLPGKYCLILGGSVNFVKPVFVGDTISVTGEIIEINRELNYLELKVTMRNQKNEKVFRGLLKEGVLNG
ncbi:MAG: MaoC family dehydratase [Lachnospiraceae bacterium]|jgi:3-hydroxybutyryl-CoA dehydratase|uniref:MaoC family dehydratase n=1 Tax=Roseburia sp. 1XD42-69 TaxID=2320088 RepID=UPI000EA18D49|nr:MaoC family dehydratase [Roseburia sp. 1XD42-69]MCI8877243.1 MaoC family dehydratase [Lachnospiraceae bacterium]MDE6906246.1 MaoC family dehydratase [Lachnospiraceae bacterium]MDE6981785.1 MaoC family dehydratase [Lachnospiraceae bacterium]RKJ60951.1 MaoC family dehydratase [Roseburia sp. 1XD42-69]